MNFPFFIAKRYFIQKNIFSQKKVVDFFSFKGRISRREFNLVLFFLSPIYFLFFFPLLFTNYFNNIINLILYVFLLLPILWLLCAQAIKRAHDLGFSGWVILFPFSLIGLIFFPSYVNNKYEENSRLNETEKINFVQIVSFVSLIGVIVGTASLILVLSVFNGFEDLILKMYNSFDPDIKITSLKGKTFYQDSLEINNIEIAETSFVLEEKVLVKHLQKEFIATVKGVTPSFRNLTGFDSLMISGNYINDYDKDNVAVIGRGVAYHLSIGAANIFQQIQIFSPKYSSQSILNPQALFSKAGITPVGIFGVQSEIDEKYIITPLSFIQNLSKRIGSISAIEIKLKDYSKIRDVQRQLENDVGENFLVQNRQQQQAFIYKILNTEKLSVFLILVFILIIATFNIVGSISMLIIDKKKDIKILKNIGCTIKQVKLIFFFKGLTTIVIGGLIGLSIGLVIAFLQQNYGLIAMGEGSFVVDYYPVSIKLADVFIVWITVFLIGSVASWIPSNFLTKRFFKIKT